MWTRTPWLAVQAGPQVSFLRRATMDGEKTYEGVRVKDLVKKVELAIPLGLFMGFLNLVPYLQTLGFVPAIVLALLKSHDTGDNFWLIMLGFTLAVLVVQTLQDAVITPKVMGKVTGLNAAVILLSLSVWGALLGFIGLIIALPLTTLLISYYKRYVLKENDDLVDKTIEKKE